MREAAAYNLELLVEVEPWPDSLSGGCDDLKSSVPEDELWQRLRSRDVPFFKLALLHQLRQRPYHVATLCGPFDGVRLAREYCHALYRSEVSYTPVGSLRVVRLLLCVGEGLFAYLDGPEMMLYGPTPQAVAELARKLQAYRAEPRTKRHHGFNLVGMGPSGPYAQFIEVPGEPPTSAEDLALHYGTSFPLWETEWLCQLRSRRSGLTVLLGPPGTGKTSYLRSLLDRHSQQFMFYYLPVSSFDVLSSTQYVGFWLEQNQAHLNRPKIAILEDAEELLMPRDGLNRDRASNLLNAADGFLGESLGLHIIATTNIPLQRLDPAVVRPGRLAAIREFPRISRFQAQKIASAKGLLLPEDGQDFSLAEVYCGTRSFPVNRKTIGFQGRPQASTDGLTFA